MSKLAISIEGFIANELKIREVTGHRVVDVSVPHTPSKKNQAGEWEDTGATEWFRATFWDEHADAVLDTVQKGSLVTLTGGLKSTTYEKTAGGTAVQLEILFPVLAAVVRRPARGSSSASKAEQWADTTPAVVTDTWNTAGSYNDETPF